MVAIGLITFTYLKHVSGMLRIASYRIKKAINMWNNVHQKKETVMYKGIIYAIDFHRTAIKFSTFLFSCLYFPSFFLVIIAVICLSLNLYALSKNILYGNDISQVCMHFAIVIVIFIFMFFFNYIGQEFMDYNNDIFFTAYNIQWYVTSLRIQKLILFFLQRGSKTISLNFGGVFILSLEFFASDT
ncbi:uncharacterized protein LOC109609805 [Camponotus floridanus]|uniref:uncharacterized protein LOC109609805 n=1 Tax=Camponotus floridanus TaxID=104421 RepID=UPI000DC676EB|nr:uncharacterized protein LOC109609805 [Camponotus floridanus]